MPCPRPPIYDKVSISRLLSPEGDSTTPMPRDRFQNPTLQRSKNGSPFIRPWVDILTASGQLTRAKKTIVLGPPTMLQREAIIAKNKVMATINRSEYVIKSQLPFGALLDKYVELHVNREDVLASSTRAKYLYHIKNHIRPAFGTLQISEVTTLRIDAWMQEKAKGGMAWATRVDCRNILSGVFNKASSWGIWKERNPTEGVEVGKKRAVREKRKLTDEQMRKLLCRLPEDVRLIVEVALFCGLRVSEILGLQWKHVDFVGGQILVRQRYHRGNLDTTKSGKSRDVQMGYLSDRLEMIKQGKGSEHDKSDEAFVFSVRMPNGWICRDDRQINNYFLRPAAKELGIYYIGFGFHAFRREAVTEMSSMIGIGQAMKMVGHSSIDMSMLYTLDDKERVAGAVRKFQERIIGKVEGVVQ